MVAGLKRIERESHPGLGRAERAFPMAKTSTSKASRKLGVIQVLVTQPLLP